MHRSERYRNEIKQRCDAEGDLGQRGDGCQVGKAFRGYGKCGGADSENA
jgi:hypothetical protein